MQSKGSNNRLSGMVVRSRISTLLLSMFATMASLYSSGRLWQDAENTVYLAKELDRVTGQWLKQLNAPIEVVDPEVADINELDKARQWKVGQHIKAIITAEEISIRWWGYPQEGWERALGPSCFQLSCRSKGRNQG